MRIRPGDTYEMRWEITGNESRVYFNGKRKRWWRLWQRRLPMPRLLPPR